MAEKKKFVLDTNVILHDYNCLTSFEENDIYIPIVVLEELDKFKKGNEQINYNAREFARKLDGLIDDPSLNLEKGIELGEGLGKLFIYVKEVPHSQVWTVFKEHKADHQILAVADKLYQDDIKKGIDSERKLTILVTKDINLRMKALSLNIPSEDYINDKVANADVFEKANEVFNDIDATLIDAIYSSKEGLPLDEFDFKQVVQPNDCFILNSDRSHALVRYNPFTKTVKKVNKSKFYGIEPRNAEQTFAFELLSDPSVKLVAITGKAGTGKTLLALAAALAQLNEYKQILLARPIVSLSNKDIGFLPGDAKEKVSPYMQPLFDNLNVIKRQYATNSSEVKKLEDMQKSEQLVIEALAFIRGRSLSDTYCIIDEAQNLTPHEIKTIITRAGENTKMVFTGDIQQIDQPYLDSQSNGLVYMIDKMKGQHIFAHVNLLKGERSELSELASNLL